MSKFLIKEDMRISRIGYGTWYMGEEPGKEKKEIEALLTGIKNGITLIDTAEMYGNGASERLIGKVVSKLDREKLFIVSKVYPHHAGKDDIYRCCEDTLKRLQMEHLDLYLLHWRGAVPLAETVACMEKLVTQGKIRHWGVSNFDVSDMEELFLVPDGGRCFTNQVLYHLGSRGIEYDLLPWMKQHQMPVMAYCPLAQGGRLSPQLYKSSLLKTIALRHGCSIQNILLAFLLKNDNVIVLPKASSVVHARDNANAFQIDLTPEEYQLLDMAFPAPKNKVPLNIV